MTTVKTRETDQDVSEFLDQVTPTQRQADCVALRRIMERVTGAPARMWGDSIVGFGRYRNVYASGHGGEFFLTSFAPRKQALTLYIMPGFADHGDLVARLGKPKTGRSCLYVKTLVDLDLEVLEILIRHSVDFMRAKYPD